MSAHKPATGHEPKPVSCTSRHHSLSPLPQKKIYLTGISSGSAKKAAFIANALYEFLGSLNRATRPAYHILLI